MIRARMRASDQGGWVVTWQTDAMSAPAFWHYATEVEARCVLAYFTAGRRASRAAMLALETTG